MAWLLVLVRTAALSDEVVLRSRMASVSRGDVAEGELYAAGSGTLPIVCLDALVPKQRLEFVTRDPAFCAFLTELGLGGLFAMTSLDRRRRLLRRYGVVARLELVAEVPSGLSVSLVGRRRVRLRGPPQRIARWRRGYSDDGQPAMGWGTERLVDDDDLKDPLVEILCAEDESRWLEGLEMEEGPPSEPARRVADLLDRWVSLASDADTYKNPDVVARRRGSDATRLVRGLLAELGPKPPPSAPTALAFYATALVNPLPPLGAALELRGPVLQTTDENARLDLLATGIQRSIDNLLGKRPF